jgi:hypothetical protein
MFKLFEKSKKNNVSIEEIHETFFTEVDRLLATAKLSNSLYTDKQDLIDKCERLKALGFTSTKEIKEAESEIERLKLLKEENIGKQELIEAINYFNITYPNYKFITEDSVNKICEKYELIFYKISRYMGSVPDVNLKHIEEFSINFNDECYFAETIGRYDSGNYNQRYVNKEEHDIINNNYTTFCDDRATKCPLEIAAPLKDFNTVGIKIKNNKIVENEIPDPIVLKPVIFKDKKYYLIVTAWG